MKPVEIVSLNVRRLRRAKGWTQREAGQRLAALTGSEWSVAVWSAAEQVGSRRQRKWDANELVALAQLFGVTVGDLLNDELCSHCEGSPTPGYTCNTCGRAA